MTSQSYGDLGDRLNEVNILTRLDPTRSGWIGGEATGNAINRACIVLLCAHLEGFIEDIVTEAMDVMAGRAKVDDIPLIFRSLHAEDHIKDIEPIKDRNSRAPKIKRMFESESSWWVSGNVLQPAMIRASMICGEMSNPGSKEIRQFLQLVDVDIDKYLRDVGKFELLGLANGLVAKRNSIAHGEIGALPTHGDVDRYIAGVRDLGLCIDEALGLSMKAMCGLTSSPW